MGPYKQVGGFGAYPQSCEVDVRGESHAPPQQTLVSTVRSGGPGSAQLCCSHALVFLLLLSCQVCLR